MPRGTQRLLAILLIGMGCAGLDAAAATGNRRISIALEAGGLDNLDSGSMPRKDGEPGNPSTGWKGSGQIGLAVAYEVAPGITLDLGMRDVDFDFGADLVPVDAGNTLQSIQIAEGEMQAARLTGWYDLQRLGSDPKYYFAPERSSKARIALGIDLGYMRPVDVEISDESRAVLGVERVETGSAVLAGLGLRLDYRLGRSGVVVGAKFFLEWTVGGELFVVSTSPDAAYHGTDFGFHGINFVVDLAYHF